MNSERARKDSINRDYVKSYSASYTNNILDTAFKDSPYLKGTDLKQLCNPVQVNFNLLRSIFLQWEAEINKFRNPYFDHEASAVQNALKAYMEVLSRHIRLDKGSLRPLLHEAVEETLYQVFNPRYFFENFIWPSERNQMKTSDLVKIKKFIRVNAEFFNELLLPWKQGQDEIARIDYQSRLNELLETWESWEDTEQYTLAFSKVVALDTQNLWNQSPDLEETEDADQTNNVNQRFAKEVRSLNDTLQKDQTTLVDELNKKIEKIESVKKSININQKFRFIYELFGGNTDEFNQVIEKVDQCSNYHEAMNTLDSGSSLRSQWNTDDQVVKELFELISRRFNEPGLASGERPVSAE